MFKQTQPYLADSLSQDMRTQQAGNEMIRMTNQTLKPAQ